ncbi:hypothetical protein B0T21DRAFT_155852 [Apiosordaria backusii]|uniref:Uncharacterized protein n=1 Tax=Apiosordaria backusii TaxID=314023 RepID=A0AA40BMM5_9PEZI|nr:hypothetical protein B0T21DRAFT_155852 [Apiosordaria backusii]
MDTTLPARGQDPRHRRDTVSGVLTEGQRSSFRCFCRGGHDSSTLHRVSMELMRLTLRKDVHFFFVRAQDTRDSWPMERRRAGSSGSVKHHTPKCNNGRQDNCSRTPSTPHLPHPMVEEFRFATTTALGLSMPWQMRDPATVHYKKPERRRAAAKLHKGPQKKLDTNKRFLFLVAIAVRGLWSCNHGYLPSDLGCSALQTRVSSLHLLVSSSDGARVWGDVGLLRPHTLGTSFVQRR